MVLEGKVLVAWPHLGHLDKGEASLVVLKYDGADKAVANGREGKLVGKFLQKDTHWEELAHRHAERHIFGSSRAESDFGLEFAGPNNRATVKGEYKTSTGFDRHRVLFILIAMHPCKISINKAIEPRSQVRGGAEVLK
jgi:hypothetical protein